MKYCDYMYGSEDQIEDLWVFVNEIREIGAIQFKEKYKGYETYFL